MFRVDVETLKVLRSGHRALLVCVPLELFLKTTPLWPFWVF